MKLKTALLGLLGYVVAALTIVPSLLATEPYYLPANVTTSVPSGWNSTNDDVILKDPQLGDVLSIVGDGASSQWLSKEIPLESRKGYRLRFKASQLGDDGSGCLCAGTNFFHIDFPDAAPGETPSQEKSVVFFTPEGKDGVYNARIRFSQWNSRREFRIAEPELCAVSPLYKLVPAQRESDSALELGDGEAIDSDGQYRLSILKSREHSNFDRPLFSTSATFNTNRFCFSKDQTVVYRFSFIPKSVTAFPGRGVVKEEKPLLISDGSIALNVGYHVSGKVEVEASRTGEEWTKVGETDGLGTETFPLASFFDGNDATELYIRLRAVASEEDDSCNFQVDRLIFNLNLATNGQYIGFGETLFADLANEEKGSDPNATLWSFTNDGVWTTPDAQNNSVLLKWDSSRLPKIDRPADPDSPIIETHYSAKLKRPANLSRLVYRYFIQNYTNAIEGVKVPGVDLSWCDADYRVPLEPAVFKLQKARPIELYAAGNDYESFQIVLRPQEAPLEGLTASIVGDLQGSDAKISKDNVELRYAYYHHVTEPTDKTCSPGYYPDALVPMDKGSDGKGAPIVVQVRQNQPVWVTVKTPAGTKPGQYKGSVKLSANDGKFAEIIPFVVNVWNFDLPVVNRFETAYGYQTRDILRYHNCKTDEENRAVMEMYFKKFGDYRVSPYSPTPFDPFIVSWNPDTNPPSCDIDFTAFDEEIKRVFEKYHFSNFRLNVQGLGGGTFEARYPGKIGQFDEDTPEYDAMMTDYGQKVVDHLKEIGMLDVAYTYTFDEPAEKDFEFVANQFAKIEKYFPGVNRMLTEEPSDAFNKILEDHDTSIDIWCPVSSNYSHVASLPEREKGARFWQYVCTVPKAPYCTEFTDHAAQELRLWHWQLLERDIVGSLVWQTTYWTSDTAYVDTCQNPYLDPMSWVVGYGLTPGTKQPWGNGDGRFIYPPLSAAVPGMNDGKVVMDEPNASIRWEMIRAGIQDIETFYILKDQLKEKGDTLSAERKAEIEKLFDFSSFTTDMTHFSLDPQLLLQRRRAVGQAVDELSR